MFDYEKLLYDPLLASGFNNTLNHSFKHKHLCVKKATGLGVTEFFLRFMAWLCVRNRYRNRYRNSQVCIATALMNILLLTILKML